MKLSTKITRIQLKQKIIDESIQFAKSYYACRPEEVSEILRSFSDRLGIILKIK